MTTDFPPEPLTEACAAAGLSGEDLDSALAAYTATGQLTPTDRGVLRHLSQDGRATYLAVRFGSDGARVAAIAYTHAIEGTR